MQEDRAVGLNGGGSSSGWCPGNQCGSRLNPEGRKEKTDELKASNEMAIVR